MTDEERLHEIIDRALARSKEPDPHVIARKLLPRLSVVQREEALMRVLSELVAERIRVDRQVERGTMRSGPSRWSIATRVCVGGEWKFRSDCTADDLFALADEYAARAASMTALSDEYRALGERVLAAGVSTLGELEQDQGSVAA